MPKKGKRWLYYLCSVVAKRLGKKAFNILQGKDFALLTAYMTCFNQPPRNLPVPHATARSYTQAVSAANHSSALLAQGPVPFLAPNPGGVLQKALFPSECCSPSTSPPTSPHHAATPGRSWPNTSFRLSSWDLRGLQLTPFTISAVSTATEMHKHSPTEAER